MMSYEKTAHKVKLTLEIDGVEKFRFDGEVDGMVEVHRREHDYLIRIEQPQSDDETEIPVLDKGINATGRFG